MEEEMRLFEGLAALSAGLGFAAAALLRLLRGRARLPAALLWTGAAAGVRILGAWGGTAPDRAEARVLGGLLLGLALLWLQQVVCDDRALLRRARQRLRWAALAAGSALLLLFSTLPPAAGYAAAVLAAQLLDCTGGPARREDDPPILMLSYLIWHVSCAAFLLAARSGTFAQMLFLIFGFGLALGQLPPIVRFLCGGAEQEAPVYFPTESARPHAAPVPDGKDMAPRRHRQKKGAEKHLPDAPARFRRR